MFQNELYGLFPLLVGSVIGLVLISIRPMYWKSWTTCLLAGLLACCMCHPQKGYRPIILGISLIGWLCFVFSISLWFGVRWVMQKRWGCPKVNAPAIPFCRRIFEKYFFVLLVGMSIVCLLLLIIPIPTRILTNGPGDVFYREWARISEGVWQLCGEDYTHYAHGYSVQAFDAVQKGMEETEVREWLGAPLMVASVAADDGTFSTLWHYSSIGTSFWFRIRILVFHEGSIIGKEMGAYLD